MDAKVQRYGGSYLVSVPGGAEIGKVHRSPRGTWQITPAFEGTHTSGGYRTREQAVRWLVRFHRGAMDPRPRSGPVWYPGGRDPVLDALISRVFGSR